MADGAVVYEMKTQSREGITFTFAYPGGKKQSLRFRTWQNTR